MASILKIFCSIDIKVFTRKGYLKLSYQKLDVKVFCSCFMIGEEQKQQVNYDLTL